jgi:hypothetical protein
MLAGGSCKKQSVQMQQLLDSPVGTEITWEYYFEAEMLNSVIKLYILK